MKTTATDQHAPTALSLRWYQAEAKEAIYAHFQERDDNPVVVLPTGAGKTPVVASICHDAASIWGGRVLVLAHVKELVEQHHDALQWVDPWLSVGIYSAGLNRRNTVEPIIIAGIQSVYNKADKLGHFDLVIIDESHLIPPDGEGMYRTLLDGLTRINPNIRLIGLTATPFRTKEGRIASPDNLLNHVCYEVGVRELINQGYLTKLRTKGSRHAIDTVGLHVRAGEYMADELEAAALDVVDAACEELLVNAEGRAACLVFGSGVEHAGIIHRKLIEAGETAEIVTGETDKEERREAVARFRSGQLRWLVNVGVYTTGFDAPNVDCVALMRATLSPGLYYQMVGRGFRVCPGKLDCLVLDFGGNIRRHGPVDRLTIDKRKGDGNPPEKECPGCLEWVPAAILQCEHCGHLFPDPKPKMIARHDATADDASPLSGGEPEPVRCMVDDVSYAVHLSKKSGMLTMRVDYVCGLMIHSEWVCFDHDGYAREKACYWWRKRSSLPVPASTEAAVSLAKTGHVAPATAIDVVSKPGEKFSRITGYLFKEPGDGFGEESSVEAEVPRDDYGDPLPTRAEQFMEFLADCPF